MTPVLRTELEELRERDAALKVVQGHGAGHRRPGLRRCSGDLCFRLDNWSDTRKSRNAGRQRATTPSASYRRDKAHYNPPIPHFLPQSFVSEDYCRTVVITRHRFTFLFCGPHYVRLSG
jgi:hypothetical protein